MARSRCALEGDRKHVDAGFDHIVLTGGGPDQEGFIRFFAEELAPKLKALSR